MIVRGSPEINQSSFLSGDHGMQLTSAVELTGWTLVSTKA